MKLFHCYCDYGPGISGVIPQVLLVEENQQAAEKKWFSILPQNPRPEYDSWFVRELETVADVIEATIKIPDKERDIVIMLDPLYVLQLSEEYKEFLEEELRDFLGPN